MQSFLEDIIEDLQEKHLTLSDLTIILPSKRAGGFFTHFLKQRVTTTQFAPTIISIEEFIQQISGLSIVDNTQLLFTSYESYLSIKNIKDKESFDSYTSWANTLLGDFNEIDRHLLDVHPFFNYLQAIQDTEHWYLKHEKTPLIERYLSFWEHLEGFYTSLKETLLAQDKGYQGLVYRKAAEDIEIYKNSHPHKQHIFVGFNALNKAEQTIFQELLEAEMAAVYWDAEHHFMTNNFHSSSLFLRRYKEQWKHYQTHPFSTYTTHFNNSKEIQFVATQKNMSQAKYVGNLLQDFDKQKLNKTAIVLADEQLLLPILYALPDHVTEVNITMGVPLQKMPMTSFFEILLKLHSKNNDQYYYKDVIEIIGHPFFQKIQKSPTQLIPKFIAQNKVYYSPEALISFGEKQQLKDLFSLLFTSFQSSSNEALEVVLSLIKIALSETSKPSAIEVATLVAIEEILLEIKTFNTQYSYLTNVQQVASLFQELAMHKTLDFKGDAYQGLQIMGVLESRVLDFEHVIMTSVNEGILPSGKSTPSFITYDLKKEYDLPGYLEKDAIYSYHFTHLLHRAKTITCIYNTHAEGLNKGEMSRFLMQLEIESLPSHSISRKVLNAPLHLKPATLQEIYKTKEVVQQLKEFLSNGISPSAIGLYIKNPLEFYYRYILGINQLDTVEETVASNTLGTIVHETLEMLYTPFVGKSLTKEGLQSLLALVSKEVTSQFNIHFEGGDYTKGKNLLIFEVAKTYVKKFILYEIEQLNQGNSIQLLSLEQKLKTSVALPDLDFPVKLKGTVDRVDIYNGGLRIIDYKTGKVTSNQVEIVSWDDLILDEKYSKALQVLAYAEMYHQEKGFDVAQAGIYSFKNLQGGFIPFATKPSVRSTKKQVNITAEVLEEFKQQMSVLLSEIVNPETPFIEKEVTQYAY